MLGSKDWSCTFVPENNELNKERTLIMGIRYRLIRNDIKTNKN